MASRFAWSRHVFLERAGERGLRLSRWGWSRCGLP